MFSWHLMIAEMLGYILLKSNTIVNVDNVMGVVLENKIVEMFYSFCTFIYVTRFGIVSRMSHELNI